MVCAYVGGEGGWGVGLTLIKWLLITGFCFADLLYVIVVQLKLESLQLLHVARGQDDLGSHGLEQPS